MHISTGLHSNRIRVGIVLEADGQSEATLSWSQETDVECSLEISLDSRSIRIAADAGTLRILSGIEHEVADSIVLRTGDDVRDLRRGDGVTVEPVRTGRGFHWQKNITVTLPGELSVRARGDFLEIVNTVDVECYVACVATSEMGAAAPVALLEAQTIVARCWALALVEKKHAHEGFDVCNDDCCQRYQGTTFVNPHSIKAARDTIGQVLVYGEAVIDARYSKNCGGLVEDYTAVWDGSGTAYLVPLWDRPEPSEPAHFGDFDTYYGLDDAYCAPVHFADVDLEAMLGKVDVGGSYYRWHHLLSLDTLRMNLEKYQGARFSFVDGVEVLERGASARINRLVIRGRDEHGKPMEREVRSEYAIRQLFSESFLFSSAFTIDNADTIADDGNLKLRGCGWGHGVGLCQMGALGMALSDCPTSVILSHYYPGTRLQTLDPQTSADMDGG